MLGALVFGAESWLAPERRDETLLLVLDERRERELLDTWKQKTGQLPGDSDKQRMLAQWVDREMLYREGLKHGLDRDDTVIRNQVIRNTAFFFNRSAAIAEPTQQQLEQYLAQHRARYTEPERWDLVHAFTPKTEREAQAKAEANLEALRGGAALAEIGERFSKGNRMRRRTRESLGKVFDEAFAAQLTQLPVGAWTLLRSPHGWHVVKVLKKHPGKSPNFSELKPRLAREWERDERHYAVKKKLDVLRAQYRVRLTDGVVRPAEDIIHELDPSYATEGEP